MTLPANILAEIVLTAFTTIMPVLQLVYQVRDTNLGARV